MRRSLTPASKAAVISSRESSRCSTGAGDTREHGRPGQLHTPMVEARLAKQRAGGGR